MRLLPLYLLTSLAAALGTLHAAQPWIQQSMQISPNSANGDNFAGSMALEGDTLVIGASGEDSHRGAVYVFVRSRDAWGLQQRLAASDGVAGDQFGMSVALSGNTVLVGAPDASSGRGAVYAFVRSGTVWAQRQELTAADSTPGDHFGLTIALLSDTAIIGAPHSSSMQGAAYVFFRRTTTWSQQAKLLASDGAASDLFGLSVAIGTDTALVGAYGNASNQGAAYVFARTGTSWTQQQKLTATDGAPFHYYGNKVLLQGDMALIAAMGRSSSAGAVYAWGGTVHPGLKIKSSLFPLPQSANCLDTT